MASWRCDKKTIAAPAVIACLIVVLVASASSAQLLNPGQAESQEIAIDAESLSYDQRADTVTASGNVVIRRGNTEIRAQQVRVKRATSEVFAQGGVLVSDPEGEVLADEVELNLEEETGTLTRGVITSERFGYSLRGDRIEKGLGQRYRIENGRFTTCDCDEGAPSWSIGGKELEVTFGGYGKVRGATFNILDLPVLYVPRAVFPVTRERQSGFLMPRFSISNRRGFQLLAPLYWAINRSQDLTLAADLETAARIGVVGEYRYALSQNFQGRISPSYFNEFFRSENTRTVRSNIADSSIPANRWSVVANHTNSVRSATAYADLLLTSDDSFLREINTFTFDHQRDLAIRTLPFTTSHAGLLRLWDRAALRVQGTFYQDLIERDEITLQRLPDADWWGQWLIGKHLLARMNVSGSDFQRRDGIDGLRLDIRPEVIVPLRAGRALFGSIRAGFRETAYHLTEKEMEDGWRGDDPDAGTIRLPRNRTREIFHVTAEAGTSFHRVYDFDRFGASKLKHTIEPLVEYTFVPGVSQDDLPMFDGEDRDNRRSLLTLGVVSRLLAKYAPAHDANDESAEESSPNGAIRELARLSLMQSLDTVRRIPPVTGQGAGDHFSDIDLDLRMEPGSLLSVRAHTGYDTSARNVSSASVGFRLGDVGHSETQESSDLQTRSSLGVTYRFITRSLLQQVDGDVQLRLTNFLGFVYAGRVDIQDNRFLENYYGLRLVSQCDCWALDFAVVDKSNPQEVEVRAQITLVGLGAAG